MPEERAQAAAEPKPPVRALALRDSERATVQGSVLALALALALAPAQQPRAPE